MEIKVIGNQLSQYGSSTFYKGLRITFPKLEKGPSKSNDEQNNQFISANSDRKTFIIGMGDCVPVRPFISDPLIECLAEIRMIWKDKSEQSPLLSLRLYFLPENTPKGRSGHGEDEVVAVKDLESPKGRIVIRAEDFISWLVDDLKWNWGLSAIFHEKQTSKLISSSSGIPATSLLSNTKLDFSEIETEKVKDGNLHSNVTVLSYSRYCRYRAILSRLQYIDDIQVRIKLIETLSGFIASQPNTRIMFCKETFDYPDLDSHEMLCPHLAPKLKGRPRGRQKKITSRVSDCSSPAPSSEFSVDSCETNDSDVFDGKALMKNKDLNKNSQRLTRNKRKSETIPEIFTTLKSTGRVAKQRLPLTPLKSSITSNKRKRKVEVDEDMESSTDDDEQDEDYDEKSSNRKARQDSGSKRYKSNSLKEENIDYEGRSYPQNTPALQIPLDSNKSSEEIEFLIRLNTFMAERSQSYPKLIWGLKDVNLFTIYTRVQKLGGFNAIADNRVWKNLFEDLSEPGKCITQGMTKRKYERILLPFERYERELRENGKDTRSELTISTIPKTSVSRKDVDLSQNKMKRRSSTSPAIEIIPLKNGVVKNELTMEQMNEIQKIIKPGHNSHDGGVSVPVHVIVRPSAATSNGQIDSKPGSSRTFKTAAGGQKENIPMSTTIVPLNRDGLPTFMNENIVELIDSDEDDRNSASGGSQNMKKRKLDILREGGLEVTPISRRAQAESSFTQNSPPVAQSSSRHMMQPNVSLMSLAPVRAPPVIQSLNMYQSTSQVFKNPKEDVVNAVKNSKSFCLDLTSKRQHQYQRQAQNQQHRLSKSQLSIEEVQRNYRGSNPDLSITLVKPHETPSSSSSGSIGANLNNKVPNKKAKNHLAPPPPLNPVIIAAANELQKLQQQNLPFFPFLSSGLDITPMHNNQGSPKSNSSQTQSPPSLDSSLMSYLSALYSNPLLQGQNILSNLSPAVEFLKLYNNSSASSNN